MTLHTSSFPVLHSLAGVWHGHLCQDCVPLKAHSSTFQELHASSSFWGGGVSSEGHTLINQDQRGFLPGYSP